MLPIGDMQEPPCSFAVGYSKSVAKDAVQDGVIMLG